ncbi:MAG TPA: trypsin-like peptidase domain-containing protein [Candidatus Paceibacterota bacterium]
MEERPKTLSVAQIVLISSALTLLVVVGVLFISRDYLIEYVSKEIARQETELEPVIVREPVVEMVERVNPAVVSVVVTKDVPVYERYYEQFGPWFTIPRLRENGTEEQEVGGGSGFIVSNDGLIVTNNHVVADDDARYSIVLTDGTSYSVDVLDADADLDIAVLKINQPIEAALTTLQFGDVSSLELGQTVVAIGNALAEFQNSVSVGVVSGLSRSIVASDYQGKSEQLDQVIQTDAAINPGNSGGPLLNLKGEVIGVNVATSRGADNIGFALPASVVKQVVESVKEHGEIVRPFLGVRYATVNERVAASNNLTVEYGALIVSGEAGEPAVVVGSPADKAGLKENDVILSIDGEELREKDLSTILRTKAVGQTITLKINSAGEEKTVEITLEKAV